MHLLIFKDHRRSTSVDMDIERQMVLTKVLWTHSSAVLSRSVVIQAGLCVDCDSRGKMVGLIGGVAIWNRIPLLMLRR